MRWPVAILAPILLASCATNAPPIAAVPASPIAGAGCPIPKSYSLAQEKAVGAELAKLAPTDPLVAFMADYGALRAAARACAS